MISRKGKGMDNRDKYKMMWEELWDVIAPPNSSTCETDGAKIYHKATDIYHKYFPPTN